MPNLYPLVNGVRYDFTSIDLFLPTTGAQVPALGFKSIAYKESLKPGLVRGASPMKLGRSTGEYDGTGSMFLYMTEWADLRAAIIAGNPGLGYMDGVWDITCSYGDFNQQTTVDTIRGIRITEKEKSHSQGVEALGVTLQLDYMYLLEDGVAAFNKKFFPG